MCTQLRKCATADIVPSLTRLKKHRFELKLISENSIKSIYKIEESSNYKATLSGGNYYYYYCVVAFFQNVPPRKIRYVRAVKSSLKFIVPIYLVLNIYFIYNKINKQIKMNK